MDGSDVVGRRGEAFLICVGWGWDLARNGVLQYCAYKYSCVCVRMMRDERRRGAATAASIKTVNFLARGPLTVFFL